MFNYRNHRSKLTPEDISLMMQAAFQRGEILGLTNSRPRHPNRPPKGHTRRSFNGGAYAAKSNSHSFRRPRTSRQKAFTAVAGWTPPGGEGSSYLSDRVFGSESRGLAVGSDVYGQGGPLNRYDLAIGTRMVTETTVGGGISASPLTPSNTTTNHYVPQRQTQLHYGHQGNTTKNYPHSTTVLLPTALQNPHPPAYDPPFVSGTASYLPQNQLTMGMVRSHGISWKSDTNDTEMVHPQMEVSAPIEPPMPGPAREDSDDSCDSIFTNTPVFPDGSKETSPPSISQAPCQNTLPSKELNANTPSAASVVQERKMETSSRGLDTITDTEPVSKVSDPALMSAANKNRSDPSESPKPPGPSHHKVPENDKSRQREPQMTEAAAQEQVNNKPQTGQLKQTQNMSAIEPESADTKVQRSDERAGHVKNSTSTGKRNKKAKHNKSGSVDSNKVTRSDSSNLGSQGKQNASEATSQGNKSSNTKTAPEEGRPLPHRLTSGGSAASTSRKRRNPSVSSPAVPPRQNGLQENITPAPKTVPLATTINSLNGPAFLQAVLNRRLLEGPSTYNQSTMADKSAHTASAPSIQRVKYEAPNAHSYYQPEGGMFKAENRQFYPPPPPVQPMQKGYPMQTPTAAAHQIGQNQTSYNQKSQYPVIRPQIPQPHRVHHQNLQSYQVYHQQNQQPHQVHQQAQLHGFHQNFSNQVRRGPDTNTGYAAPQIYPQQRIQHQQYSSGNFPFHQPQTQKKPPQFQRTASHTAPPTPHYNNRYVANVVNHNIYGGAPFNRFTTGQTSNGNYGQTGNGNYGQTGNGSYGQTGNGNYGNIMVEFNRGHVRNCSNQSLHDYGRGSKKLAIVQAARYKPRAPSPPPIVRMSVRNRRLLWPIGPFIPFNKMTYSPWELDSTTFVNVFCTTVGVLRLPFSVEFLRMLKSVLPPKHGDHIITFPTVLADMADMTPYWERCYYCQKFLFKYAKHLGFKPFEELPIKDWPRVEIMLGIDNTEYSTFNIYLSQPDEKRLLFRCVEQKLGPSDKAPKATFFVTVHQTGVNQVQYSDPYLQDDKVPLPPLDGSRDPRTAPEFQYNLPHYLCLNERRGLASCGFTDIGVPAKRLNFHPFGKTNFDSLWYGMAHLQELVIADDNASVNSVLRWNPDRVFGIPNVVNYCKKRTAVMMGNGEPKFAEHDEVLRMNCKAAAPPPSPPTHRGDVVVTDEEFEWERESTQTKSSDVNGDVKSTST
ncbi:uncharacterized protein DFL_007808 [Arthrobotrys flagrans]|uniref:Uncharacterized protein n=1 Tax=Arthrobotrys flagrans TaxID=97331 RepID=A0A436ZX96_ARTFL|nr:hypothetical protein DFL_007808 [Arthrobotrys flagrans]